MVWEPARLPEQDRLPFLVMDLLFALYVETPAGPFSHAGFPLRPQTR
jgi:hypothetical protein